MICDRATMNKTIYFFFILILAVSGEIKIHEKLQTHVKNVVSSYNTTGISTKCANFYLDIKNQFMSLAYMVDSSSIWPGGLLVANWYDLGTYYECMGITGESKGEKFYGKYCLTSSDNFISLPVAQNLRRARCVPSLCTNDDVAIIFKETVLDDSCFTYADKKRISTGAIVTIAVLGSFILITVASTIYEMYLLEFSKSPKHELCVAFSAIRNTKKIFTSTTNPDQLLCLNGLRAISMIMIVFFHEYQNTFLGPLNSLLDLKNFIDTKYNMYIFQGSIAVDTFLTVGGLVVVYTFMRNYDKKGSYGVNDVLMSYVHRYFRLTPVLAVMIVLHAFIFEYVSEGPLHANVHSVLIDRCKIHWWSALLYVQNYVNVMRDCVPQSWYLSMDMQLFILSPFYLIPLRKWPKVMNYVTASLIFAAIVIPFYVSYSMEMPYAGYVMDNKGDEFMKYYYMKTHSRFGVYLIGMICGYAIYKLKKNKTEIKLNKVVSMLIWTITIAVILLCYFGAIVFMGKEKNVLWNAVFNSTFRLIFSLGVCSLILLCVTGNGGIIDTFLSLPIFQTLTKLSYSMYLIHYSEIILRVTSLTTLRKISTFMLFFDFFGDFTITFILAYFCVIMFESPFMVIDKYLFPGPAKDKRNKNISEKDKDCKGRNPEEIKEKQS